MKSAGQEECRLAIERGDYHQGIPAITVITDGGWSKHKHKHPYNAKSGVAIIIGKETGKLLYIGVRNKYCSVCARAEKSGEPLPNTNASRTGAHHRPPWKRTSYLKGSANLSNNMASGTYAS